MKSIILSCTPAKCEKIVNGDMSILVRKKVPKETPFKVYIYETKGATETPWMDEDGHYIYKGKGQVIGEFICDKVDKYTFSRYEAEYRVTHIEQEAMCLNHPDLIRYGKGKTLYGLHITDLKIYDKPRELSEFKTPPCEKSEKACGNCKWLVKINTPDVYECECYVEDGIPITRPPQNYIYVEE